MLPVTVVFCYKKNNNLSTYFVFVRMTEPSSTVTTSTFTVDDQIELSDHGITAEHTETLTKTTTKLSKARPYVRNL